MKSFCGLLVVVFLSCLMCQAQDPGEFILVLPQVARGGDGPSVETRIVVSNLSDELVEVSFASEVDGLLPDADLSLEARATGELPLGGGDLTIGEARLRASGPITAVARVATRPSADSADILSQVVFPAAERTSKVVIPVFREATDGAGNRIENTAVALAALQGGAFRATLRNAAGSVVSTREVISRGFLADFESHLALFLDELFPDLPGEFNSGSLTIEHVNPERIPQALAASALYQARGQLLTARVAAIDTPGEYFVEFASDVNDIGATSEEMAGQYGFLVDDPEFSADTIVIVAADEVSRAVFRDPRVVRVTPNQVIGFIAQGQAGR